MNIPQAHVKAFQKEILEWYKRNQRDLPWRKDRDPYHILVSEVMLQQTQVQRVIPKYENWLKVFPNVASLAKASTRDVLFHWSGLGYNRRALFLQRFAQEIREKFGGRMPQDEKTLRSLPGIGAYTCRALLCFAFNKQVAVIDTNVRKVIAVKFFNGELPADKVIEEVAWELLPQGRAYEWNQALMDYASTMLKKHKIAIPKQYTFHDSDRYFRGLIVRLLLQATVLSYHVLMGKIEQVKSIDPVRLEKILQQMQKDHLLVEEKGNFRLP